METLYIWAAFSLVLLSMMRVSEPILDMEMANYSEVLDPTYTTLEFETMQILYNGNGEFCSMMQNHAS